MGAIELARGPDGRRRRRFVYGSTAAEVVQKIRDAAQERDRGRETSRDTALRAWLARWLIDFKAKELRPRTFQSYQLIVRHLGEAPIGATGIGALTPMDVQRYITLKQATLSAKTVQYHHQVLRAALNDAKRMRLIATNVAEDARVPTPRRVIIEAITPEHAQAVLAAVEGHRVATHVRLSMALGLRQSELLGLRWEDVDTERGLLYVRRSLHQDPNHKGNYTIEAPKSQRSRRTLPLTPDLVTLLSVWHERQKFEEAMVGEEWRSTADFGAGLGDLIFRDEWGAPERGARLHHQFRRLLSIAGLPHMRWHDLRHACASLLLSRGVPLRTIQDILGHQTIVLTADLYTHLTLPVLGDAMDQIAAVLASPPSLEGDRTPS